MKLYSIYIYTGGEYAMILPIATDTIGASLMYIRQIIQ